MDLQGCRRVGRGYEFLPVEDSDGISCAALGRAQRVGVLRRGSVAYMAKLSDLRFAKHAKCEALGTDLKRELVIDVINYQIHHGLGNGLATFTASTI